MIPNLCETCRFRKEARDAEIWTCKHPTQKKVDSAWIDLLLEHKSIPELAHLKRASTSWNPVIQCATYEAEEVAA